MIRKESQVTKFIVEQESNQLQDIVFDENKNVRIIIFDSCLYVLDSQRSGKIITTLKGRLGKYGLRLALPRIILYEVSKITKNSCNDVIKKIRSKIREFTTVEETNEIKLESKRLETHYFECHNPDSVILATAKILGAILVSLDRKLLRTAELEGVEAYHLKNFMKNWSVIA